MLALGLLFVLNPKLLAQEELEAEEFAEPVLRDNLTDLGGEAGSFEFNYVLQWKHMSINNQWMHAAEVEWTATDRLGLEVEYEYATLSVEESDERFAAQTVEAGMQYSWVKRENWVLATGVEVGRMFGQEDGAMESSTELEPFVTLACRLAEQWNLQWTLGPNMEWEEGEQEQGLDYSSSALFAWEQGLAGVELNGTVEDEHSLSVVPQVGWSFGAWSTAMGLALPIIKGNEAERFHYVFRLIYEIE